MNRTKVLSLRMPVNLKKRLEVQARSQGVSLNQLANYLINCELTQMETISKLEQRLSGKKIPILKKQVRNILKNIPGRNVPDWDRI